MGKGLSNLCKANFGGMGPWTKMKVASLSDFIILVVTSFEKRLSAMLPCFMRKSSALLQSNLSTTAITRLTVVLPKVVCLRYWSTCLSKKNNKNGIICSFISLHRSVRYILCFWMINGCNNTLKENFHVHSKQYM